MSLLDAVRAPAKMKGIRTSLVVVFMWLIGIFAIPMNVLISGGLLFIGIMLIAGHGVLLVRDQLCGARQTSPKPHDLFAYGSAMICALAVYLSPAIVIIMLAPFLASQHDFVPHPTTGDLEMIHAINLPFLWSAHGLGLFILFVGLLVICTGILRTAMSENTTDLFDFWNNFGMSITHVGRTFYFMILAGLLVGIYRLLSLACFAFLSKVLQNELGLSYLDGTRLAIIPVGLLVYTGYVSFLHLLGQYGASIGLSMEKPKRKRSLA